MLRRALCLCVLALTTSLSSAWSTEGAGAAGPAAIPLPPPAAQSKVTVEEALKLRRSVRSYAPEGLPLQQVSQLLWAGQGITEPVKGLRTAPSAVESYPLRLYLVAGDVKGLAAGVYRYVPQGHKLEPVAEGDQRAGVGVSPALRQAPALILYVTDTAATKARFGPDKARAYAFIEVGHSAQNILLEEVALGLSGIGVASVDEPKMRALLKLTDDMAPVYVLAAGRKQ